MAPADKKKVIAPLVVDSAMQFLGVDGPWSTFAVQVGPYTLNMGGPTIAPQPVRLLPGTSLAQTYVIDSEGCGGGLRNITRNCEDSRGLLFDAKRNPVTRTGDPSNTMYADVGRFSIFGDYGSPTLPAELWMDTLGLGYGNSVNVSNVPLARIPDARYTWTGLLGIDPRPTNFTQGNGTVANPSLLKQLNSSKSIPSVSWSYHAGSYNQDRGKSGGYGSLILGGWDTKRMKDGKRIEYTFHDDWEQAISVRTLGVILGHGNERSETLLRSDGNQYTTRIDSALPYLYLPPRVCDMIESKLGLKWNNDSQHYLISDAVHAINLQQQPFLEFDLAPINYTASAPEFANFTPQRIRLSYKHLALRLQPPRVQTESLYLPIRKADSADLLLGRAFLQEVYLISNDERKSFALGEINWAGVSSAQNVLPILPGNTEVPAYLCTGKDNGCSTNGHKPLSKITIIGIVVGVGAFISLLVFSIFFCRKTSIRVKIHRNASKKTIKEEDGEPVIGTELDSSAVSPASPYDKMAEMENTELTIAELETKTVAEMPDTAGILAGYFKEVELDGSPRSEIFEMEGSPVSPDKKQSPPISNGNSSTQLSSTSSEGSVLGPLPPRQRGAREPPAYPASPIPQTPQEYYGRHARRRFGFTSTDIKESKQQNLDAILAGKGNELDNRPPASAIPQTPLEYYGGRVPAHRQQQAQVPRTEVTAPLEEQSEEAQDEKPSAGGLQVPPGALGRGDEAHQPGNRSPASPIPQTPLEMYGRVPASLGSSEQRQWLGRAPDVPSVTLIPPTPSSPSVPRTKPSKKTAKSPPK